MAAPKGDGLGPFPVKEQLPSVDFCLTSNPPWHEAIILGFQHFLVMLGTTVMIGTLVVPQMGGGPVERALVIQTLLMVSGLNTLLQTLVGCRTAVVIGGSYASIIPVISIIFSDKFGRIIDPYQRFVSTMRAIQGALMFASIFPVVIGVLGLWRIVMRILSPLAAIPLVTLTGLGLFQFGFPQLAKCVEIGLPALVVMIFISQYLASLLKPFQACGRRYATFTTIALIWALAAVLTAGGAFRRSSPNTQFYCRTDRSGLISAASWIKFPYPFQWGRPTLNAANGFAVMAAAFVAMVESTGTFIASSRYASATPLPPSVVSRGIAWLGAGHFINGIFGAVCGPTASVANAGLLGLNQIGSRRVTQIAAIFMLFFSILGHPYLSLQLYAIVRAAGEYSKVDTYKIKSAIDGKFGALLASIPLPIFAAIYCVLFAYVVSAGLSFLQFCNLNSFRTKFILGFSLYIGLSVPQYFNEVLLITGHTPVNTRSMAFNSIMQVIFSSPATVAGMIALFLDVTLHRSHDATRKDSGRHFWSKFRTYEADTRSEEFYSLPWGLNKYFPSV